MSSDKEVKIPEDWAEEVVMLVIDFYIPAKQFTSATDFMTTTDIVNFFHSIRPTVEVDPDLVFNSLEKHGFQYDMISPGQLRWMLIDKSKLP